MADFWTRGRELGVRYEELYDVPAGGFRPLSHTSGGGGGLGRVVFGGGVGGDDNDDNDDDEEGAGTHHSRSRRWSMWNSVKRTMAGNATRPNGAAGGYNLVSGSDEAGRMA